MDQKVRADGEVDVPEIGYKMKFSIVRVLRCQVQHSESTTVSGVRSQVSGLSGLSV